MATEQLPQPSSTVTETEMGWNQYQDSVRINEILQRTPRNRNGRKEESAGGDVERGKVGSTKWSQDNIHS